MFSWQGLLLMFMFGVLCTMTATSLWLLYSELKLSRAEKQHKLEREDEIKRIIRKKLLDEEDDEYGL